MLDQPHSMITLFFLLFAGMFLAYAASRWMLVSRHAEQGRTIGLASAASSTGLAFYALAGAAGWEILIALL